MPFTIRYLGVLFLLLAAACGGRNAPAQNSPENATTVRVENQSFLDMNIFVLRGGDRARLGTVTGNSTQVLRIPSYLVFGATPLRFLADPIGGNRTPISQEIVVQPGDQVTITIPPL